MPNFDIERLMRDMHVAAGMTVALFDAQFRAMHSYHRAWNYCSLLHNTQEAVDLCLRSDLRAFHFAQQKGQYAYTCPFGFLTAVTAIRSSRKILGYLYIGGVMPREQGVEGMLECAQNLLGEHCATEQLRAYLEEIRACGEDEFASFCALSRMLCEYIEQNDLFPTRDATIGELTEKYILQNLRSKITLGRICLNLHCSKATLTESFRREYGVTIVQFITDKRLERACSLLSSSKLPVRAVAEECGFSGMEYFSAQFKKRYGLSPLAYRKANAAAK